MSSAEGAEVSRIQKLWLLLLEDFRNLTDEQVDELLVEKKALGERLSWLWNHFPYSLEDVRSYRARKKELDKLSTEQLREIQRRIGESRAAVLRSYGDNDDDLSDSFFEAPPINSDEHVTYELLKERGG